MKSFKKIAAAAIAALALGLGFVSCATDSDDELKLVATFYGTTNMNIPDDDGSSIPCIAQITTKFFNNKEYLIHMNVAAIGTAATATMDWDDEIGTYSGDPTKNGETIKMTAKKSYDTENKKWVTVENPSTDSYVISSTGAITINETEDGETVSFTLKRQ